MAQETEKKVKVGDTIKVHYTGIFENGEKFDSSEGHEPIEFKVGEGKLIRGFENSAVGKKLGESYNIVLQPEDAYGLREEKLVQDVPISALAGKVEPKVGTVLALRLPYGGGKMVPATIIEVGKDTFKLDLNSPMAGKILNFEIKIVDIK
jgi:peptidylprolyl isomerase